MTQEDKELLLKDLCARLPYDTMVHGVYAYQNFDFDTESDYIEYKEMDNVLSVSDIEWIQMCKAEVKPYLFPLSSMTEEQLKEMQEIIGNPNEACISVSTSGLNLWLNSVDTDPAIWLDTVFELQDWLNKNNFDYRGLIPKGLAIDATGLNIY